MNVVKNEIIYRGLDITYKDSLMDTFNSSLSILSRGKICSTNYSNFLDGIKNGEDTNFMLQCLFNAKSIQFFDIDLYEVVLRSNSASRVFSKSRIDCMIDSVKRVYLQREEHHVPESYKR